MELTRQQRRRYTRQAEKHIDRYFQDGLIGRVEHGLFGPGEIIMIEKGGYNCIINLDSDKISFLRSGEKELIEIDEEGNNLLRAGIVHTFPVGKVPESFIRARTKMNVIHHQEEVEEDHL